MTSHLLQGQRRGSALGATLKHLRAQGALFTLVLADGGVVHHGQEWVFAIPQTGENVLKARKEKNKTGGMNERETVLQSGAAADAAQCSDALLQAVHLH